MLEERLKARPGSVARPIPEALQRWRGGHPSAPTLIAATRRAPIARISARRYLRMLAPLFMPARRWGGTTLVESTRAAMSSNPPPGRQGRDRARAESECLKPSRGCSTTRATDRLVDLEELDVSSPFACLPASGIAGQALRPRSRLRSRWTSSFTAEMLQARQSVVTTRSSPRITGRTWTGSRSR